MSDLQTKFTRYMARTAVKRQATQAALQHRTHDHIYLQTWLIIATVCAFAALVAFQNKLFEIMIATDKSYLSLLIIVVFLAATGHAAWNIVTTSGRIKAANKMLDGDVDDSFAADSAKPSQRLTAGLSANPAQFVGNFVRDVKESLKKSREISDREPNNHVLEIYADQLRSPVEIGWFIVDILIRLGLIGTIVGFILILRTLVGGPLPSAEEIQTLLVSMSGGMGTALFTTLAGLTTATVLGLQYMILGRSVETLIATLIRIDENADT